MATSYSIQVLPAVSSDPLYNGFDATDVLITNVDNDNVGVTVSAISGDTTESSGTATFTVVLNSEPTARRFHRTVEFRHHRRHGVAAAHVYAAELEPGPDRHEAGRTTTSMMATSRTAFRCCPP
ncbi:MAG: hypothetical protein R3C59_14685 [Planctomycetaceae bacterium]